VDLYAKYRNERAQAIARSVVEVASEIGHSPAQVALAWVRQQTNAHHIPIIGARTLHHLEDNLASLDLTLGDEHLARLDEASAVDLGFPHAFLASDQIGNVVHGETRDALDSLYSTETRTAH
jgi:aryl-alcohol dehydrogenase-like predicted oxidoreductase